MVLYKTFKYLNLNILYFESFILLQHLSSYAPALLPTITGIFRGKDNYRLEIDGEVMKGKEWRKEFKEGNRSGGYS